jgi:hypothetical protein
MNTYTARQIGLYYKTALAHENEAQARAILAHNVGSTGGTEAQRMVNALLPPNR